MSKLNLSYKITGNHVSVEVHSQEWPLGVGTVYNDNDTSFHISSSRHVQIDYEGLFILGTDFSVTTASFTFEDEKSAEYWVEQLEKALRILNRGKLVYGKY